MSTASATSLESGPNGSAGGLAGDAGELIRGLTRVWRRRSPIEVEVSAGLKNDPRTGRPALVERILASRGLSDQAVAKGFLSPSLTQLHDPLLIPDLDRAAARILAALTAGEPIAIYGDYDVDGVTATAILYHTLRKIRPAASAEAIRTYVPHRLEEGYGLNAAALEQLGREGVKVVVSVDCGITAVEPAKAAVAAGVELIITDHHSPPATLEALPAAVAVVHPRRPDSAYPFEHLSGAGVAYKLAWRLATMACGSERVSAEMREHLIQMLAFAALGTVADVVPLVGENRVIARFGLARVKHSSVEGLRALVEASGLAGEDIDSEDAGFKLGPRLNACGRLGHAKEAVELFTTATGARAVEIAKQLSRLNDQRRKMEQETAAQAIEMAIAAGMTRESSRAIVLAHESWHPGVIGIVCSRLVERFHRPTILMQRHEGMCHGSGRSIEGYSLHAGLCACAGHLTTFGGHDMAAGLKLREEHLPAFAEAFGAHAAGQIAAEQMTAWLKYDAEATLDELTPAAVDAVQQLAPFGAGNPRPRLLARGLTIAGSPQVFGNGAKHLGVHVRGGPMRRMATLRLVGWNWAERAPDLFSGLVVDAVVSPKLSKWNGRVSVEPELEDLRVVR